jgi:hypothetical protein
MTQDWCEFCLAQVCPDDLDSDGKCLSCRKADSYEQALSAYWKEGCGEMPQQFDGAYPHLTD